MNLMYEKKGRAVMIRKSLVGDCLVFVPFFIIYSTLLHDDFSLLIFMGLLIVFLFLRNSLTTTFPKWSNESAKRRIEYNSLTFFIIVIGNGLFVAGASARMIILVFLILYEVNKYVAYKWKVLSFHEQTKEYK